MELYQLQYFQALCQTKSYTKASELLRVSQPTVSIAVKKLEDEYGASLIDRSKRAFTLTPLGEALRKKCELILSEVADANAELKSIAARERDDIRIAVPDNICPMVLEKLAVHFLSQDAGVSLRMAKRDQDTILRGLADGSLDIGVLCAGAALSRPELGVKKYKKVELAACFSFSSEYGQGARIPCENLRAQRLLIPSEGGIVSEAIRAYFRSHGVAPQCSDFIDGDVDSSIAFRLATHGLGISFIDKVDCRKNFALLDPPLEIDVVVAWSQRQRSAPLAEAAKQIIDYILSIP